MKTIPKVPKAIQEGLYQDIHEQNDKLLLDQEIADIQPITKKIIEDKFKNQGESTYISKKYLKEYAAPANLCKYSIYKHENTYYAVYPGKVEVSGQIKDTILGRGQYGAAKLAQNLATGEWGVLKTQKLDASTRASRHSEGNLSIRMGIALDHIETVSSKDKTGRHKMLMKYVPGIELKDLLSDNGGHAFEDNVYLYPEYKFSFSNIGYEERIQIALAVLKKVHALNEAGIVHGDLHSGNIKYFKSENGGAGVIEFLDYGYSLDLEARKQRDQTALAANPNNRDLQKNLHFAELVLPYKDIQTVLKKVIAPLLGIGEFTFNKLSRPNNKPESLDCTDCCFIEGADLSQMDLLSAFKSLLEEAQLENKPYPSATDAIEALEDLRSLMCSNRVEREQRAKRADNDDEASPSSRQLRHSLRQSKHAQSPMGNSALTISGSKSKLVTTGSKSRISPRVGSASISPVTEHSRLEKQSSKSNISPPVADASITQKGRLSRQSSRAQLSPALRNVTIEQTKEEAKLKKQGSKEKLSPTVSNTTISPHSHISKLEKQPSKSKLSESNSSTFFKREVPPQGSSETDELKPKSQ